MMISAIFLIISFHRSDRLLLFSSFQIIHPKSDEQREILAMAVKNILLFRSLDASQMQEVLDAMFERRVVPNEIVIQQGDDGDNFYVIQR